MALGQFTANALRMGDLQRVSERDAGVVSRSASPVDAFREQMARESQNREALQAQARRDAAPTERGEPRVKREPGVTAPGNPSASPTEVSTRPMTAPSQAGRPPAAQAGSPSTQSAESAATSSTELGPDSAGPCSADNPSHGAHPQEEVSTAPTRISVQALAPDQQVLPATRSAKSAGKPLEGGAEGASIQSQRNARTQATMPEAAEGAASTAQHEQGGIKAGAAERANGTDSIRTLIPSGASGASDGTLRVMQRAEAVLVRVAEATHSGDTPQFQLSAPPDSPVFASQLGDRVGLMLRSGIGEARLILHPEALGTVAVSLKVKDSEANVVFSTGTEAARAALDAALPQLKDLLAQQGVQLASATTHTQMDGGSSARDASQFSQFSRGGQDQPRQGTGWRPAHARDARLIDGAPVMSADLRGAGSGRLSIFA